MLKFWPVESRCVVVRPIIADEYGYFEFVSWIGSIIFEEIWPIIAVITFKVIQSLLLDPQPHYYGSVQKPKRRRKTPKDGG